MRKLKSCLLIFLNLFVLTLPIFASYPVKVDIFVGTHYSNPQETSSDHKKTEMDYLVYLSTEGTQALGLGLDGTFKLAIDVSGDEITPYEAYLGIKSGSKELRAGLQDIGSRDGIVQGNSYMTETGRKYSGKYGNDDDTNPYLVLFAELAKGVEVIAGVSMRSEDISVEDADDKGNVTVMDLVANADLKSVKLGLEIENKTYKSNSQNKNTVYDAETHWGLSGSIALMDEMITPFLSFGNSKGYLGSDTKSSTRSELNLGCDLLLTRNMGSTIGFEQISGDKSSTKYYLGVMYNLNENTAIGGSYWSSNQKAKDSFENVKDQIDIEARISF